MQASFNKLAPPVQFPSPEVLLVVAGRSEEALHPRGPGQLAGRELRLPVPRLFVRLCNDGERPANIVSTELKYALGEVNDDLKRFSGCQSI
jgi:hypothetical protein